MRPGFKFHLCCIQVVFLQRCEKRLKPQFLSGPSFYWRPSVIPALARLNLKDFEFKDILGYIMSTPTEAKTSKVW